jgi:hypothetical protein
MMKAVRATRYGHYFLGGSRLVLVHVGVDDRRCSADTLIDQLELTNFVDASKCISLNDLWIGLCALTEDAVQEVLRRINREP